MSDLPIEDKNEDKLSDKDVEKSVGSCSQNVYTDQEDTNERIMKIKHNLESLKNKIMEMFKADNDPNNRIYGHADIDRIYNFTSPYEKSLESQLYSSSDLDSPKSTNCGTNSSYLFESSNQNSPNNRTLKSNIPPNFHAKQTQTMHEGKKNKITTSNSNMNLDSNIENYDQIVEDIDVFETEQDPMSNIDHWNPNVKIIPGGNGKNERSLYTLTGTKFKTLNPYNDNYYGKNSRKKSDNNNNNNNNNNNDKNSNNNNNYYNGFVSKDYPIKMELSLCPANTSLTTMEMYFSPLASMRKLKRGFIKHAPSYTGEKVGRMIWDDNALCWRGNEDEVDLFSKDKSRLSYPAVKINGTRSYVSGKEKRKKNAQRFHIIPPEIPNSKIEVNGMIFDPKKQTWIGNSETDLFAGIDDLVDSESENKDQSFYFVLSSATINSMNEVSENFNKNSFSSRWYRSHEKVPCSDEDWFRVRKIAISMVVNQLRRLRFLELPLTYQEFQYSSFPYESTTDEYEGCDSIEKNEQENWDDDFAIEPNSSLINSGKLLVLKNEKENNVITQTGDINEKDECQISVRTYREKLSIENNNNNNNIDNDNTNNINDTNNNINDNNSKNNNNNNVINSESNNSFNYNERNVPIDNITNGVKNNVNINNEQMDTEKQNNNEHHNIDQSKNLIEDDDDFTDFEIKSECLNPAVGENKNDPIAIDKSNVHLFIHNLNSKKDSNSDNLDDLDFDNDIDFGDFDLKLEKFNSGNHIKPLSTQTFVPLSLSKNTVNVEEKEDSEFFS